MLFTLKQFIFLFSKAGMNLSVKNDITISLTLLFSSYLPLNSKEFVLQEITPN